MKRYIVVAGMLACWAAPVGAQERVVPLDTVRVDASSRAARELASVTRGVEVISAEQVRRAGGVQEALARALGVDLMPRSPALADVALRGSSFEQVLVLVDGARVSDAQTGHFDLNLAVPLEQVERVEVLRGPASALFGADAMGGVINVVTRGSGTGSSARLEAGSFGTAGLALAHALRAGGLRLDAAGDLRHSDGHRQGTDYRVGAARLALHAPLAGGHLRADAAHADRAFGADGFYGPYPSFEQTRATTASLAWRADPARRVALEPMLSARRHADHFILRRADPAFYQNRHETLQWGGELVGRALLAPGVRVAVGGEGYLDQLRSERLGDRTERRVAALAEAAAGRVGAATATAGVRADWHQAFGTSWSPSLSAAWWPASGVRLRASTGHSFRVPTWTERFYRDPVNVGSAELAPERAWSAEVGAESLLPGGVRLGVTGFVRRAHDLIDWAHATGTPPSRTNPWRTRNVEEASFRGVEAEAALTDPLGTRWSAQGSWLSVTATEAAGFTSKYALRPLVESLALAAERELGGADLLLRAHRARRAGEDAYLLLDTRLAFGVGLGRIFADLRNLLDEHYPDITGLRAPGRSLVVGVEWRGTR